MSPEMKREISSGGISDNGLADRDYDAKYDTSKYDSSNGYDKKYETQIEYSKVDYSSIKTDGYIKQEYKPDYEPLHHPRADSGSVQGVAVPV